MWAHDTHPECKTDQVGSYVPAVPLENDNSAFHAYSAVPMDRVMWWKALPN